MGSDPVKFNSVSHGIVNFGIGKAFLNATLCFVNLCVNGVDFITVLKRESVLPCRLLKL